MIDHRTVYSTGNQFLVKQRFQFGRKLVCSVFRLLKQMQKGLRPHEDNGTTPMPRLK